MSFQSIFDQTFDVAIHGSGYAAFGAVLDLLKSDRSVLLFYRRADILWESGRSFAAEAGELEHPEWEKFLKELEAHHLCKDGLIDSAGAEIMASDWLVRHRSKVRVLYGAWPVAAEMQGDSLSAVRVATKSGERTIRARSWIDASDEGSLWELAVPESRAKRREPDVYEQRVLLGVRGAWETERISDSATLLESRLWEGEKTLRIQSERPRTLNQLHEQVLSSRKEWIGKGTEATIIQFSVYPLPVYSSSEGEFPDSVQGNLISASSAYSTARVCNLADRFRLGVKAAERLAGLDLESESQGEKRLLTWSPAREETDLLIAGAGTGGAVAALAAQRRGGEFLIVDPAPFAGGVGTGGMINGYCHGELGGLFEQYDAWAAEIDKTLDPAEFMIRGWHPEGKKIAFERVLEKMSRPLLGEAVVYAVEVQDQKIVQAKIAIPGGMIEVTPKTLIDATGDGDVAALAGASYEHGREVDGHPLAFSQPCLRVTADGGKRRVAGGNFDAGWVDATDPEDLSRARLQGVSQYLVDQYTDDAHILIMAPVLGLRQSRNFITEHVLTVDDVVRHIRQPDSIGRTRSFLDTHTVDFQYEDDETLFWLWGCKNFRGEVYADMPYRMLIPKGIRNLWLACRAAGVTVPAAYAVRMQRDIQRMGEVAGYAAVEAAQTGKDALEVTSEMWRPLLEETGAYVEVSAVEQRHASIHVYDTDTPLVELDKGIPSGYLWFLYKERERYEQAIVDRLNSPDPHVSWLAAVVLAMWEDPRAESRLLQAIEHDEIGVETPSWGAGAFMQWVDIPNWLLAVNLLRRCGTGNALPALRKVAEMRSPLLDIRTSVAITLGRMASRLDPEQRQQAASILERLLENPQPETFLPPSRSLYRSLRGEPQVVLKNTIGLDTREDHSWRLPFVVAKAARQLRVEVEMDLSKGLNDERALVRRAFRELVSG